MKKKGIGLLLMASLLTGCGGSSSVTYDPDHFVDYYISGQDFETLNYLTSMSARDLKVIANIMDGMVKRIYMVRLFLVWLSHGSIMRITQYGPFI